MGYRTFHQNIADKQRFEVRLQSKRYSAIAREAEKFEEELTKKHLKWYQKILLKLYKKLLVWKSKTIYRVYVDGEPDIIGISINEKQYYTKNEEGN